VPAPEITFRLLDGKQAGEHADELQGLHAEAYPDPPDGGGGDGGGSSGSGGSGSSGSSSGGSSSSSSSARDGDATFAERFGVQRRQPGYVLAEARSGEYLIGYASGMPLRPSTSWWRNLTTRLPEEVTAEHPGRTFALVGLAVRPAWRRQYIAETLHDMILANRPEERATLTIPPAAAAAQNAFQKWGWRKVARTRDPRPGSPVSDVLVTALPANSAP
jgi:ribosomal protein S18 acetylase RimI-like enzyme